MKAIGSIKFSQELQAGDELGDGPGSRDPNTEGSNASYYTAFTLKNKNQISP